MPGTRLEYVADREADMVEMMRCARDLDTPADWLVRAKHNRCLPDEDGAKLWDATTSGTPLAKSPSPSAHVKIRRGAPCASNCGHRRSISRDGKQGRISVTCVVARELGAPIGVKPIEWRLLTNRVVTTPEQAIELIDWYRAR